jgi:signal transduction histidine kinase
MAITHLVWLDFLISALSFMNACLLLWLGFTVILNAQNRTWGIWLAASGLLFGGSFFLLHSIVIGIYPNLFSIENGWWWQIGWVLVVFLPFAWYIDILWYAGFLNSQCLASENLRSAKKIHTFGIRSLIGLLCLIGVIFVFIIPYSEIRFFGGLNLFHLLSLRGTHLIIWLYAAFIFVCMGLSLYALRQPVPSDRLMGDEARKRALPYLSGATISLFVVTLLVILAFGWVESELIDPGIREKRLIIFAILDIAINALILISVFLIGESVVAYEVYTGETLPRRGLMRYWRRNILLSFGFSVFAGLSLVFYIKTIYILVLTAGLGITFFAMMTWRLVQEREQFMKQLRPFVRSEQIFKQVIQQSEMEVNFPAGTPDLEPEKTLTDIFNHLCEQILHTELAVLTTQTHVLSFKDAALSFTNESENQFEKKLLTFSSCIEQQQLIMPVEIEGFERILWEIPLWRDIGRLGTLFLGRKIDDSLYTQEEIEIARAACERLVDTQAGIQMTKHLVNLQHDQLVQNQLLDQRARQMLHDEILPDLHAILIGLNSKKLEQNKIDEEINNLESIHKRLSALLHNLPTTFSPEISRTSLIDAIKQLPELQPDGPFTEIRWIINADALACVDQLPIHVREVLYFAIRESIRNAAAHGQETSVHAGQSLELQLTKLHALEFSIKNSGGGVVMDRFIQRTKTGGGIGLTIHHTMMAIIGGNLFLESVPGQLAKVTLRIPADTLDALIQQSSHEKGQPYLIR